jgi:hypothetical protein
MTLRYMHNSDRCTVRARGQDFDKIVPRHELTIRGPALNGVNIVGFDVNRASLRGSIHRSGSNSSASGPQSSLLRCVNSVEYQNVVDFGKYNGCRDSVG